MMVKQPSVAFMKFQIRICAQKPATMRSVPLLFSSFYHIPNGQIFTPNNRPSGTTNTRKHFCTGLVATIKVVKNKFLAPSVKQTPLIRT